MKKGKEKGNTGGRGGSMELGESSFVGISIEGICEAGKGGVFSAVEKRNSDVGAGLLDKKRR